MEYIDGRLLVSPLPTRAHQDISYRLVTLLRAALPPAWTATPAWSWKPGADEYIPDVMVHPVTDEQTRFTGIPALCVEVLSGNRGDDRARAGSGNHGEGPLRQALGADLIHDREG